MSPWESDFDRKIDEYVAAFEAAWASGLELDFEQFLPEEHDSCFGDVVVELARIDLERRWNGERKTAQDYFDRFPTVFADPQHRSAVAFEEFRLRRMAGESVSKDEFEHWYSVDASFWPDVPVGSTCAATGDPNTDWIVEVSQWEAASKQRLAAARKRLPPVGSEFLGFELVGVLGEGALGRVYLARQGDLSNRFVALKVAVQVTDEPQRLAQLQHTNIVPVYSCHQVGQLQATCMPFLGANTLRDVLDRIDPPAEQRSGQAIISTLAARTADTVIRETRSEQPDSHPLISHHHRPLDTLQNLSYQASVVWFGERVAGALAYAHDHGIVHCDLKPANVVLTDDGEPLLVDFHLAANYRKGAGRTTVVGGTIPYMAPEHLQAVRDGGAIEPPADVYSLGVILFEMLVGELPFPHRAESFDDACDQLISDRRDLESVRQRLAPVASPALRSIVLKCLAPSPDERYPTARQLHEDLHRQLNHRPLRHIPEPSLRERCSKWFRRHPRLSSHTTVGTVAVLMLLLAAVGWQRSREQARRNRAALAATQLAMTIDETAAALTAPDTQQTQLIPATEELARRLSDCGITSSGSLWRKSVATSALDPRRQDELRESIGRAAALMATGTARIALHRTDPAARRRAMQEALAWNQLARNTLGNQPALVTQTRRLQQLARDGSAPHEPPSAPVQVPLGGHDHDPDPYLLAIEAQQSGDLLQAAQLLEQVSESSPQRWPVWFSLGSVKYSMGKYDAAETAFSVALALHPRSSDARLFRGLARQALGRLDQARADLRLATQNAPERSDVWANLALVEFEQGRHRAALEAINQAIRLRPEFVRAYLIRRRVLLALGDSTRAQQDLDTALQKHPSDAGSFVARGVAQIAVAPRKALDDFQQALNLDPNHPAALQNAAHTLAERLGQPEAALPFLSRLIALQPHAPQHLASRGVLLARIGQRDKAIRDAEAALDRNPTPVITLQVACIYSLTSRYEAKDEERAVSLVHDALRHQPQLAHIAAIDPDLAPVRKNPKFLQLIRTASTLAGS